MLTILRIVFDNEIRVQAYKEGREPFPIRDYMVLDLILSIIMLIIWGVFFK
jgi:hypothetical protein